MLKASWIIYAIKSVRCTGAVYYRVFCDYHPDECTNNEKQVSRDAFWQQFDLDTLEADSRIEYSQINDESEITLTGSDESIAIYDLDFSMIEW